MTVSTDRPEGMDVLLVGGRGLFLMSLTFFPCTAAVNGDMEKLKEGTQKLYIQCNEEGNQLKCDRWR